MVSDYQSIPGFEHLYLEDSWVLDIKMRPRMVEIELEAVLTESHPAYQPPMPGTQYRTIRGTIRFVGPSSVRWAMTPYLPSIDATGEEDYGGIDEFTEDAGTYTLVGLFGQVVVQAESAQFVPQDAPRIGPS